MRGRSGAETGWHRRPDWRLDAFQAAAYAERLEATGHYWCRVFPLAQGIALLHACSRRRPFPVRFTFRTAAECEAILARHDPDRPRQLPLPDAP